jgi:hypothetical protein
MYSKPFTFIITHVTARDEAASRNTIKLNDRLMFSKKDIFKCNGPK